MESARSWKERENEFHFRPYQDSRPQGREKPVWLADRLQEFDADQVHVTGFLLPLDSRLNRRHSRWN